MTHYHGSLSGEYYFETDNMNDYEKDYTYEQEEEVAGK